MGPEDLERLVEELLPTLNTKRRLLRDRLRPRRIILVRHGESVGNRDKTAYQHTPDSKIELTPLGELQGAAAGQQIRTLVGNGTVRFFYSPYMRTRQTLQEILKAFKGQQIEMCAEPRLREQDFGNFQDAQQMELVYRERQKFGRFYYRFPNGEAGTDVFDRVSDFWSSLLRSMDTSPVENLVLVTHGAWDGPAVRNGRRETWGTNGKYSIGVGRVHISETSTVDRIRWGKTARWTQECPGWTTWPTTYRDFHHWTPRQEGLGIPSYADCSCGLGHLCGRRATKSEEAARRLCGLFGHRSGIKLLNQ
ncbi:Phosphoglycerate mutase-like protein AT74 (At-74) [Durusdinium trenchii]|uniref:Phosphoglycerate mutase-like protein AT74 (At-74) n=1 Tax=Durusdinium trenchii TaxID=1381693 RepID=A0ABP0SNG0_9DINO